MSALGTTLAIAVTLAGIGRLAATDPKRRRSFDLPPFRGNRQVALAMTAVLLPSVLLLAIGSGADFVAWLGAVSVAGWAVAAVSPRRTKRAMRWLAAGASWCRDRADRFRDAATRIVAMRSRRRPPAAVRVVSAAHAGGGDATAERIEALEQRMAALEAALGAQARPPVAGERRRPRSAGRTVQLTA